MQRERAFSRQADPPAKPHLLKARLTMDLGLLWWLVRPGIVIPGPTGRHPEPVGPLQARRVCGHSCGRVSVRSPLCQARRLAPRGPQHSLGLLASKSGAMVSLCGQDSSVIGRGQRAACENLMK